MQDMQWSCGYDETKDKAGREAKSQNKASQEA